MTDYVDLIVVQDHVRADKICEALEQAGIDDVKCWPEDILSDPVGLPGRGFMEQLTKEGAPGPFGPFHVRVSEEDLPKAQAVLSSSELHDS